MDFGVAADIELHEQLDRRIEQVQSIASSSLTRLVPWAAGAAILAGMFGGRRGKRESGSGTHAGSAFASTALTVLRAAVPLVSMWLRQRTR